MTEHRACYGRIFPSMHWHQSGKERPDGVFGYVFQQPGTVRRPPDVTIDLGAWDRCVECREFTSCLQLSTAKVTLEAAVRN
jgi:hypothetical protein